MSASGGLPPPPESGGEPEPEIKPTEEVAPPPVTERVRPGAITAVAILFLIFGILELLGGAFNLVMILPTGFFELLPWLLPICGIAIVISLLYIIMGVGLLGVKKWAWIGSLALTIIHLVMMLAIIAGFMGLAAEAGGAELAGIVGGLLLIAFAVPIVIDIIILILLVLPSSRMAFA